MPVYTYECENGHRFEARQSFNDAPLGICPTCGAKVHRVIQPVGVVFKGSGFYVTDSRGKQNLATSGAKKDEGGEAAASNASNGSSENGADKAKTEAGTAVKETAKTTTESKSESKGDSSSKK